MRALLLCTTLTALPVGAEEIEAVLLHPLFSRYYACAEHWDGQFQGVGDALGTDCTIMALEERDGRTWLRAHAREGLANEDWFGWQQPVLAPVDGEVVRVNVNDTVNTPGRMGTGQSTFVLLRRDDGLMVLVAHLAGLEVKKGQKVKAGTPLGKVGNNGQSRHPHVHVSAWRGDEALQIRFDQRKIVGL